MISNQNVVDGSVPEGRGHRLRSPLFLHHWTLLQLRELFRKIGRKKKNTKSNDVNIYSKISEEFWGTVRQ